MITGLSKGAHGELHSYSYSNDTVHYMIHKCIKCRPVPHC